MDESERSLVRFSQLVMLAIAIGSIWVSIIGIAFSDDANNSDFAVLAIGGLLSASLAIGWIEVQSRGHDHHYVTSDTCSALVLLCHSWYRVGRSVCHWIV